MMPIINWCQNYNFYVTITKITKCFLVNVTAACEEVQSLGCNTRISR